MRSGELEDYDKNNFEHKDSSKYFLYPGDVFRHTCDALDALPADASPELLWGTLLHDVGKPPMRVWDEKKNRYVFNAHDSVGGSIAKRILTHYKFSNDFIDHVCALVANHMKFCAIKQMRKSTLVRFMTLNKFNEHMELHRADCISSHGGLDSYNYAIGSFNEVAYSATTVPTDKIVLPKRVLNGSDLKELGIAPGPIYKEILETVENGFIEGTLKDKDQAVEFVKMTYIE